MADAYRHEYKHLINAADAAALKLRLGVCLPRDPNVGPTGEYDITSLYFDSVYDTALREKEDGVPRREKFRLRRYNGDFEQIRLEKKSKIDGLCRKDTATLTATETQNILDGRILWMRTDPRPLVRELYARLRTAALRPKTLVVYRRTPFVYPVGNVRVTIDSDILTGGYSTDLLGRNVPLFPAAPGVTLLEVKYDAFLPELVRDLVGLPDRRASGFSKYAVCRAFERQTQF